MRLRLDPSLLGDLDKRLFGRVAASRLRGAHPLLPRLSRAADHGLLWFGTAAVLGATGTRNARRAALRGTGSLAIASAVTNSIAKPSMRRRRPVIDAVPFVRRLPRQPITTSFPSGHAASAAAFAVGVALESPRYAILVLPLAAGVAASRVYVGVHYPGDVVAGAAIGMAAAALTCRWWPVKPVLPAAAAVRPRTAAPALPDGEGLTVVVNPGAGLPIGPHSPATAAERLRKLLPAVLVVEPEPGSDVGTILDEEAGAAAERGGALGVCGGDGSVNAAATAAVRHAVPLAVFPGGTFNHFAGDLGVEMFEDTARAVCDGDAVAVDLARVQVEGGAERAFLNTFSIGVYPELVRAREELEGRIGKWPAVAVALARVLPGSRPLDVEVNGRPRRLWLLFAGNGTYQPPGFAPTYRTRLDDGLLDVRAVDGSAPFARTRLLLAALTGTLGDSRVLVTAQLHRLHLKGLRGVGGAGGAGGVPDLAYDGEISPVDGDSLVLGKRPGALTVYRPPEAEPFLAAPAGTRDGIEQQITDGSGRLPRINDRR